jgi:hypothetical protein
MLDNHDNPALHIIADKPRRYPIFHRFCDRHILMSVHLIAFNYLVVFHTALMRLFVFSYEMQPWDNELSASLVPDFDKGEVQSYIPIPSRAFSAGVVTPLHRSLSLPSGSGLH